MRALGDAADLRRTSLRIGVQTGLLVVGCLLVVGALLFAVYERAADAAADRLLRDATAHIDSPREAPPGVQVAVVTPSGRSVSPAMPDGFPDERQLAATTRDGRVRQDDVVLGGDQYTVRTAKVGDRVTQAVLDRHEGEEERGRILTALLVAGAVGVLLAALVAAWMARRAVRPMADTIAMQRRFVADASHELRTPLTLLSTRAQLLARKVHHEPGSSGQLVADLDGVLADTKVLTEILDDLLVAADTRTIPKETVDLAQLAEQCVAAARASADQEGVALVLSPSSTTALVEGSPTSLRRAVTALVDNAVGHAESEVRLTVGQVGHEVVLTVSDDGPGVPVDEAPRLFARFTSSRAERPVTQARRHYGLGLALVADVAAAHDGQVSAGDRQDGSRGARFTLTLPARGTRSRHVRHPR
ncbi:MAG: two-component system, OmpR family, sensor kinase [Nocardioidaceae bacterium]|jgi:signal transduction histidine kinase|nr:two-component system, OmpR family, sensor kinase [Nocardioidaceae bacterium]